MSNPTNYSNILTSAAKAIGIAAVINAGLYYILTAAGVIDPTFSISPKGDKITIFPVVISTILFMIVGTIIYLLLSRFSSNPGKVFTYVCLAGFIITLGNPFFAGLSGKLAIGLDLLHIAPAFFLWRALGK